MHPFRMAAPLDDVAHLAEIDKGRMLEQMLAFPRQIEEALQKEVTIDGSAESVCLCGMGGSAIGGDILCDYAAAVSEVPIAVVRGLDLPKWVGPETLVLMVSYSGNTWEVNELFERAKATGASIVGVTSGGALQDRCESQGSPVISVPKGLQPRAALGYLLGSAGVALDTVNVLPARRDLGRSTGAVADLMQNLSPGVPTDVNMAKKIAVRLNGRLPVIYAPRTIRSVALRWQTQINENAKMIAFSGEYPEMNHNQIVGWVEGEVRKEMAPIFLRSSSPSGILAERMAVTVGLIKESKIDPLVVELSGRSVLETVLIGIALGDLVSFYLAALRGVDPTPVNSIVELKKRMR